MINNHEAHEYDPDNFHSMVKWFEENDGGFNFIFYQLDKTLESSLSLIESDVSAHDLVGKILELGEFDTFFDYYLSLGQEKVFALGLYAQNLLLRVQLRDQKEEILKHQEISKRLGNQRDKLREELKIANEHLVQYSSEIELTRRQ